MDASMPLPSAFAAGNAAVIGMFPSSSSSSLNSLSFSSFPYHQGAGVMVGMPHAQRPVPEFLYHLTRMLRDPTIHHLIEWDAGRIVVHDPVRLESDVLGKYYRHSKYSSFQRQLNYFGFSKHSGKRKMSPCSYTNDDVTTSLESLIKLRRKPVKKHRPALEEPHHGDKKRGKRGASHGRTISCGKSSVPPMRSSLAHQVSCASSTSSSSTPTSDAIRSNCSSDSEHGHKIDLDSFRSGLCGGINSLFSESFQTQIAGFNAATNTKNINSGVLPTISSALSATEYCSQPLLVSAEEFKAPGECAPLRGALPAPAIKPTLPLPTSLRQHQHVVSPLPSSLDGPSSSLSDHSTFNTSTGVQSAASLPLPNTFTVQHLQQQVQREQGQSISATLNHQEAATQDQRHQQKDTDDDLATFLALESVFGVGFDEQKSGDDGADDNLSGESASASGDSWLPNPL